MEGKVKLTGEQAKELTNYIEKLGLSRIEAGALISEGDFYAGAAAVIHYLTEGRSSPNVTVHVPPMWILGLLSGRSPTTHWEKNEEVRKQLDYKLERQFRLHHNAELMYEYVTQMYEAKDRHGFLGYAPDQILNEMAAHARLILEDVGLYDFWSEEEE